MHTYTVNFSTRRDGTSIHGCACARIQGRRNGEVRYTVVAATAAVAAALVYADEDMAARRLPYPKVCGCAGA